MSQEASQSHEQYIEALSNIGSPSRPVNVKLTSWDEETKQLEQHIVDNVPIEGKWQSYVDGFQLIIPPQMRHLFQNGGVITFSTESHLLLFGLRHWSRMQRLLSKDVGLSPVNNSRARHLYSHMYKFNKLNDNGSIDIPFELVKYAGLSKEVVIIGMIYYAEIHEKASYMESEKTETRKSLLDRFRRMK